MCAREGPAAAAFRGFSCVKLRRNAVEQSTNMVNRGCTFSHGPPRQVSSQRWAPPTNLNGPAHDPRSPCQDAKTAIGVPITPLHTVDAVHTQEKTRHANRTKYTDDIRTFPNGPARMCLASPCVDLMPAPRCVSLPGSVSLIFWGAIDQYAEYAFCTSFCSKPAGDSSWPEESAVEVLTASGCAFGAA
jgi:hypothetical protein